MFKVRLKLLKVVNTVQVEVENVQGRGENVQGEVETV